MDAVKAAKSDWKSKNSTRFDEDDNLLGVGVGPKEVSGRPTEQMAVKFFVRTKKDGGTVPGRAPAEDAEQDAHRRGADGSPQSPGKVHSEDAAWSGWMQRLLGGSGPELHGDLGIGNARLCLSG